MNRTRLISLLVCIALIFSAAVALTSCDQEINTNTDTTEATTPMETEVQTEAETSAPAEKIEYTISVVSEGKLALSGVEFEVYADAEFTSLKAYGETNANGKATVKLVEGQTYYLKMLVAPDGYKFEESYTISGKETSITLKSYIRKEAPAADFTYQLGDVVHDFVLFESNDNTVMLSDALETYGCVVLNFWYISCSPCRAEFPYIQSAYDKYSDKVGFCALNGNAIDSESAISNFMAQNGYTFPTGKADSVLIHNFGITAFPTTIVIDRYGVICLIETGSVPEEAPFVNIFNHFSNPDYSETTLYAAIDYVPAKG